MGPSGQRAVGMEDRVVQILPTLIGEPGLHAARILDEAVAIDVAGSVDPGQRAFDRRPELRYERGSRRCAAR